MVYAALEATSATTSAFNRNHNSTPRMQRDTPLDGNVSTVWSSWQYPNVLYISTQSGATLPKQATLSSCLFGSE